MAKETKTNGKGKETKTLTPEELKKKEARKAAKAAMKAAKNTLYAFTQTPDFGKLPKEIQEAMTKVSQKPKRGGGANRVTLVDTLKQLFPKVGATIHELELFKQTKMGRGEMRKKLRYMLKKAEPAERMWVTFDEKAESWKLVGIGEKAPADWE